MSSGTGPSAQNMSHSSSNADLVGFDLPPMPVPYEDFHFSLDLPDNIEASDLSLLEKGDFDTLFGPSSVTGTPSIVSGSALFGTATPAVHTPAASSAVLSRPGGSGEATASTATASHDPSPSQNDDAAMASVASETTPTATRAPPLPSSYDPSQGPPPPPDFQPPPPQDGQGMFSFESLFGSGDAGQSTSQHQQQQQPQPHGHMAGIAIPTNASQPAMPLFDTNETDFLSDFLKGFEASWDFNPSLPNNMPSYAAAAAAAQSRVAAGGGDMGDGNGTYGSNNTVGKRGGRANAAGPSRPAPLDFQSHQPPSLQQQHFYQQHYNGYSHPPHAHVLHHHHHHHHHANASSHDGGFSMAPSSTPQPAAAAFGGHLAGALSDDVPDSAHSTGSKRSFGNGRVGEEKRRGSLAQVETGFYHQQQQPRVEHWPSGLDDLDSEQGQHQKHGRVGGMGPSPHSHSHHSASPSRPPGTQESPEDSGSNSNSTPKRELLTETEKRQNHILSEQRRRNHIREGFAELVSLLDLGRLYGARGLGLSSGAGTGIEDEGLDDRTDVSSDEESDEEAAALAKSRRKKARAKKNALLAAAAAAAAAAAGQGDGSSTSMTAAAAAAASRGRGKGRGRGGSAGGGAGSKSAVLFQAVDLIKWLDVSNAKLEEECQAMEEDSGLGSEPVAV